MDILCIRVNDFSNDNLNDMIIDYVKDNCNIENFPIWIFDIHNTIKYDTDKDYIDIDVLKLIEHLVNKHYTIIFLSYDGSEKRMYTNNMLLNKINILKQLPKIFIMKREKGIIINILQEYIKTLNISGVMDIIFVDDKQDNIDNIDKHVIDNDKNRIKSLRYLSRLDENHHVGVKDLNNLKLKFGN